MSRIELIIPARQRDLGGFSVHRILPYAKQRMVGPFIFLDHMGPATFAEGKGVDVRPHPHIGLATVTYLFSGSLMHRDSLGSAQLITPGDVNWMTAGRGIVHSERTDHEERSHIHDLHGIQSWVALPREAEETSPEFFHHEAESLPEFTLAGAKLRLIAGEAYGHRAPVKIHSPLFYLEVKLETGTTIDLPDQYSERAVYVVSGEICIDNKTVAERNMAVFGKGEARITTPSPAHVLFLGGEPFPEPRYIYWNFVSSSQERIEQAKCDWEEERFPTVPGDNKERIPLPPS